ncbi:MAG: SUKH-3 domain-containing protein [Erythrobacter sp.]
MELLTSAIEPDFKKGGWYLNRTVTVPGQIPRGHPAYNVMEAFGGLKIGHSGTGEECACSDIEFDGCSDEDEDIEAWQALLMTKFVGLGTSHHGHEQLWLDGEARLFSSCLVAPGVLFLGDSFSEGIEKLLRGRRGQPMLLSPEEKVMAWGEWFTRDDDTVLTPDSFTVR